MVIIAFVVDTSASMYQRSYLNGKVLTYLDVAKLAVEWFLQERKKNGQGAADRYLLLTFENPPNNIKSGWKESMNTFKNELNTLEFSQTGTTEDAIKNTLDFLNQNRSKSGVDSFGHGRCPLYFEASIIVIISDDTWTHNNYLLDVLQSSDDDFMKQRFRWDQRLFYLALRIPGNSNLDTNCSVFHPQFELMKQACRLTHGRSYSITSECMLYTCLKKLIAALKPCVVVDIGPLLLAGNRTTARSIAFKREKCLAFMKPPKSIGFWPLPESYRPDVNCEQLPKRSAHPKLMVDFRSSDLPQNMLRIPSDRYKLGNCVLGSHILREARIENAAEAEGNKSSVHRIWPVFLNTGVSDEKPFGYLKSNARQTALELFVLPYNYPALLPLLEILGNTRNFDPSNSWLIQFRNYLDTVPKYYYPFMRRVFTKEMKMSNELVQLILPRHLDSYLSNSIIHWSHLTQLIDKIEQDEFCTYLQEKLASPKPKILDTLVPMQVGLPEMDDKNILSGPDCLNQRYVIVPRNVTINSMYNSRNPYEIPRRYLVNEVAKMRRDFYRRTPVGLVPPVFSASPINNIQENPINDIKPSSRRRSASNPYDLRMRNMHKREAGPISRDVVFNCPRKKYISSDAFDFSALQNSMETVDDTYLTIAEGSLFDVNSDMAVNGEYPFPYDIFDY